MNEPSFGGREPLAVRTAIVAAVTAIVHLLVLLGVVDLSPDAETALVTAVDLIAAAVIVVLVRPKVTPVDAPLVDPGMIPDGSGEHRA